MNVTVAYIQRLNIINICNTFGQFYTKFLMKTEYSLNMAILIKNINWLTTPSKFPDRLADFKHLFLCKNSKNRSSIEWTISQQLISNLNEKNNSLNNFSTLLLNCLYIQPTSQLYYQ